MFVLLIVDVGGSLVFVGVGRTPMRSASLEGSAPEVHTTSPNA